MSPLSACLPHSDRLTPGPSCGARIRSGDVWCPQPGEARGRPLAVAVAEQSVAAARQAHPMTSSSCTRASCTRASCTRALRATLLVLLIALGLLAVTAPGAAARARHDASSGPVSASAGPVSAPLSAPSGPVSETAPGSTSRRDAAQGHGSEVTYDWPLGTGEVTRPFDNPARPWLAGHRGVDLAGSEGAQVRAAADGVVAFAGNVAGKPVVSIDHADGLRTTYEPVLASVSAGQPVARGAVIGTLVAGHGSGADLHWGARRGRQDYVDPTLLVNPPAVIRLYPLRR